MPEVVPAVRSKINDVSIIFRNLRTNSIVSALSEGEIDLGFVSKTAVPKNLQAIHCATFGYQLFVPKSLAGGLKSPVEISELEGLPLAVLEGHGEFRRTLDGLMANAGLPVEYHLECSSSTQIALAVSTLHAGFLPKFAKSQLDSREIRILEVKRMKSLSRSLSVAWNPRRAEIRPIISSVVALFGKKRSSK